MAKVAMNDGAIDSEEDETTSDQSVIELFKRLIDDADNQNTVAQIIAILDKDNSLQLWDIYKLEGEIYLTIIKRYLKDWPQLDEFNQIVSSLKTIKDLSKLNLLFVTNYFNLKAYLYISMIDNKSEANCDLYNENIHKDCDTHSVLEETVVKFIKSIIEASKLTMATNSRKMTLPWWTPKLEDLKRETKMAKRKIRCSKPRRKLYAIDEYRKMKRKYKIEIAKAQVKSWRDFSSAQGGQSVWNSVTNCVTHWGIRLGE